MLSTFRRSCVLAIGLGVVLVLGTLAAIRYHHVLVRRREAVLSRELKDMRKAIWDYTHDKGCSPSSLDDLVSAGYLREIPVDPMTKKL